MKAPKPETAGVYLHGAAMSVQVAYSNHWSESGFFIDNITKTVKNEVSWSAMPMGIKLLTHSHSRAEEHSA
jgi:hypothetical protein